MDVGSVRLRSGEGKDAWFGQCAERIRQRTQGHRQLDGELLHDRRNGGRLHSPSLQHLHRSRAGSGKRMLRHDQRSDLQRERRFGRVVAVHRHPGCRQLAWRGERQERSGGRLTKRRLAVPPPRLRTVARLSPASQEPPRWCRKGSVGPACKLKLPPVVRLVAKREGSARRALSSFSSSRSRCSPAGLPRPRGSVTSASRSRWPAASSAGR